MSVNIVTGISNDPPRAQNRHENTVALPPRQCLAVNAQKPGDFCCGHDIGDEEIGIVHGGHPKEALYAGASRYPD